MVTSWKKIACLISCLGMLGGWARAVKPDALVRLWPGDGFGGRLDDLIIATVRARFKRYGKPVLLGECGLDSAPPRNMLEVAARAEVGIRHAIWASVVSGAMNGRMLWWQDG